MNNVCAVIVGIDNYDQQDWSILGPCNNALAITDWLLGIDIPPNKTVLILDTTNQAHHGVSKKYKEMGVDVRDCAEQHKIDKFFRTELKEWSDSHDRLFLFWSGHGFVEEQQGTRILACRDYKYPTLIDRTLDFSSVTRILRSEDYKGFEEQIFLVDACGEHLAHVVANPIPFRTSITSGTKQLLIYASQEGELAWGENNRGIFTELALSVLKTIGGWPRELNDLSNAMLEASKKIKQTISMSCENTHGNNWRERFDPPHEDNNIPYVNSLYPLLNGAAVSESRFIRHYRQTVSGLGMPRLFGAKGGINGMISELASLNGSEPELYVPEGLLQFLVRLSEEEELTKPINAWLAKFAKKQNQVLATLREKIAEEKLRKFLFVDVEHDLNSDISGFKLFLFNRELMDVPGITFEKHKVQGWEEFSCVLRDDLQNLVSILQDRDLSGDIEIHFVVDPPLFDFPFHTILTENKVSLGSQYIVILRCGDRIRRQIPITLKVWREYDKVLRSTKLSEIKVILIPPTGRSENNELPKDKGLCYMNFIVTTKAGTRSENRIGKETIRRLLTKGTPYLLLNDLAAFKNLGETEKKFRNWLGEIGTLNEFPDQLAMERTQEDKFACQATLLWDDPELNPFGKQRGPKMK